MFAIGSCGISDQLLLCTVPFKRHHNYNQDDEVHYYDDDDDYHVHCSLRYHNYDQDDCVDYYDDDNDYNEDNNVHCSMKIMIVMMQVFVMIMMTI